MADDAARGADPEFFELAGLAASPGDELVQVPGVEPGVGVRLGPQRAPAGCLALDAQLADAERRFADKYMDGAAEMYHDGRHGWLRVVPSKITSWDFRKLASLPPRPAS